MSVSTQHPEYAKHYPKWVMMRDALNDEVIKKGTVYLSKTPGMLALDREGLDPEQNVYCGYKNRAQYPLWVSDSVRTMSSLPHRQLRRSDAVYADYVVRSLPHRQLRSISAWL